MSYIRTSSALSREAAAKERLESTVYYQSINLAAQARSAGQVRLAELLLLDCKPSLRGWEWRYLQRLRDGQTAAVNHSSHLFSLAISRDGKYIAVGGSDGVVTVRDTQQLGVVRVLHAHAGWARSVAFSPDGLRLVTGGWDRRVRVWDVKTGQPVWGPEAGEADDIVQCVAFRPDGGLIVTSGAVGSHSRLECRDRRPDEGERESRRQRVRVGIQSRRAIASVGWQRRTRQDLADGHRQPGASSPRPGRANPRSSVQSGREFARGGQRRLLHEGTTRRAVHLGDELRPIATPARRSRRQRVLCSVQSRRDTRRGGWQCRSDGEGVGHSDRTASDQSAWPYRGDRGPWASAPMATGSSPRAATIRCEFGTRHRCRAQPGIEAAAC